MSDITLAEHIGSRVIKGHNRAAITSAIAYHLTHPKNKVLANEQTSQPQQQNAPQQDAPSNDIPPEDFLFRMLEHNSSDEEIAELEAKEKELLAFDSIVKADKYSVAPGVMVASVMTSDVPYKKAAVFHILARFAAKKMDEKIVTAEEADEAGEAAPVASKDVNKLLILVDPDSAKLVQRIYADYVSEEDLSKLVQFILAFDKLLFEFRDGKPLEKEEIEELEEIEEAREQTKRKRRAIRGRPKAKKVAPSNDSDDEQGDEPDSDFDEVEVASNRIPSITKNYNVGDAKGFMEAFIKAYSTHPVFFGGVVTAITSLIRDQGARLPDVMHFFTNLMKPVNHSFEAESIRNSGIVLKNKNQVRLIVELPMLNNNRKNPIRLVTLPQLSDSPEGRSVKVLSTINNLAATREFFGVLSDVEKKTNEELQKWINGIKETA